MAHRIQPGWRYSLAQLLLRLLYGRPWHFIAAWPKVGPSAVIFPVNNGRVLLAQRAGEIEHIGCWSGIGGFLELPKKESFAEGVAREFYEETGCHLNVAKLPTAPHALYMSYGQVKQEEASSDIVCGFYYASAPANLIDHLHTQEETSAFAWFDATQCREMIATGKIPPDFTDSHAALAELFQRLEAGEIFPPLPLVKA
ncbi:MAG: NUDIX hydrolase [Alphaproteobacteria bacterium]|nr:MAG: NUDIX hydrolase [Alphaproteobacteria bacterium]